MSTDQAPPLSRVEVTIAHNRPAFFYEAFTPTVTINGRKERRPWGTHLFSLPPGDYEVAVSYPWIVSECGKNLVRFSLAAGETKRVRYCARLIRFIPGAISVTSQV
jgi:hypothetical protein